MDVGFYAINSEKMVSLFLPLDIAVLKSTYPSNFGPWMFLKTIGNRIGTFLGVDNSYQRTNPHIIARILVEVDLKDGLVEDIEVEIRKAH
jgi:hypothetical protein